MLFMIIFLNCGYKIIIFIIFFIMMILIFVVLCMRNILKYFKYIKRREKVNMCLDIVNVLFKRKFCMRNVDI